MRASGHGYERAWGTGLIILGVALLGVAFVLAFGVLSDPGDAYDRWVPADEVEGAEASYDWTSTGLVVNFVDTSESGGRAIESWAWNFGRGVESSDPNSAYSFSDGGEYSVTLEVVDGNGISSRAEGTVEIESGAENTGEGAIGLGDIADDAVAAVERSTKGGMVVVLVIGMLVVLTMIGGRVVPRESACCAHCPIASP